MCGTMGIQQWKRGCSLAVTSAYFGSERNKKKTLRLFEIIETLASKNVLVAHVFMKNIL
jgi:hypothetical protein